MKINPRQIEAFRLVMLRGSVTMAANELAVSQPAVSRLIRDLEMRLGLDLFERRGNFLVPTPEATLLLAEVERTFTGLDAIARFALDLKERRAGALRVVALPAMAMGYIPRFVGRFIADRRLDNVHVHGMPSYLVVEAMAAGQADIGFAAAPFERPGLIIEPLSARAVAVMPQTHRLARRTTIRPDDLAGERFVRLADGSVFGARIDTIFEEASRNAVVATPLAGIACSLVLAGAGIAIVDPFSASDFVGRGVIIRPLEPAIDIHIASVVSAQRKRSRVVEEFLDALRADIAALDEHHVVESARPVRRRTQASPPRAVPTRVSNRRGRARPGGEH